MFKNRQRHKKLSRELCANRNRFYKLAYAWTGDSMLADDLVQEAMQKAFLSFDSLNDDDKLNAWTCRIMVNCHRDWLRRQRDLVDIDDYEIADTDSPDRVLSHENTSQMLRRCIAELNEKHCTVLTLVDLMELSYEEVSQALDIPIGTVMSRLCRARQQLRQRLENQDKNHDAINPNNLRRIK